jgi:hypothetical protein
MAKRKKRPKKRNPEAKKLESPVFRQRVVPTRTKPKDVPPSIEEWQ